MSEQVKKRKRKRKLKGGTKVAIVIASIVLVVAALGGVGYGIYQNYYNKMNVEESYVRTEFGRGMRRILEGDSGTLMWAEHVYNVLLIGQDNYRDDGSTHSDAMILVSINEHTEEIVLTSLMRDSWVHIPGYGAERLNEAINQGGPELLMETIEMNFGVRVDNYVMIDFFAFIDAVDALGGVDIEITEEELPVLNNPYLSFINTLLGRPEKQDWLEESGINHLNGAQALAYARIRYLEGADFARTERQRKVLDAIFEKMRNCGVGELTVLLDAVLPYVTTDVGSDKLLSLIMDFVTSYKDYELVQYRVPVDGSYYGWIHELTGEEKNVLSIDIEINSAYMIQNIYGVNVLENEEE